MGQLIRTALLITLFTDFAYTECQIGCTSCLGVECSGCDTSYYLYKNSCYKCPENCLSCVSQSNCITCKAHKWGIGDSQCFSNCKKECLNSECYDDTGYCMACAHGKFGRRCQHNCDICKSGLCGLNKCTDGCKNGFYESQTDDEYICYNCSKNCTECVDANLCRKCNDEFYLTKFYYNGNAFVRCVACTSVNECSNYCYINGCNQCKIFNNELLCTDCQEGELFNGVSCEKNTNMCSQKCSTNCDSNGMCLGSCIDGWSGDKCSEKCNEKCFICSKDDKDICIRCKGDFYFADCSVSCNPSCIKEQGNQTCSTDNGFCLNGCIQRFWDKNCNQSCSDDCVKSICDRNTGNCTRMCKEDKKEGTCVQTTTNQEANALSSLTTVSQFKALVKENNDFIIGLFYGVGISVVVVLITVLLFLVRRRYLKNKQRQDHSQNVTIPTYQNTRTNFESMEANSTNVPNTYECLSNNRNASRVYSDIETAPI